MTEARGQLLADHHIEGQRDPGRIRLWCSCGAWRHVVPYEQGAPLDSDRNVVRALSASAAAGRDHIQDVANLRAAVADVLDEMDAP